MKGYMMTLKEIACTIRATTRKENKGRYHEVIEKFYGVRGVTSDILY
jgi:hypothetical protein